MATPTTHFFMSTDDQRRLAVLPWQFPLDEWEQQGVQLLLVRRGDSRHPVVFVELQGVRYAIKETTPRMAEKEIHNLQEIERRGIPSLSPTGYIKVHVPPIVVEAPTIAGMRQYIDADRGYTITRLAPRVVPHVLLYRLPLTKRTKQRLLSAVAVLMVELHEHGVYWGDPSLANALIRIDGNAILAIMADAETAELRPETLSEGLREQDLAQFGESLAWQAEDLRQARGLPEDVQVLDDSDYQYFRQRYRIVCREHDRITHPDGNVLYQAHQVLQQFNQASESLIGLAQQTMKRVSAVLPGSYQRQIYELLHITIPRNYARRFFNLLLGHQAILSNQAGSSIRLEEAAQDWYERYHLPTILLLRQRLTVDQDPMRAYFAVMEHKWKLSLKAGYEIPIEEALLDWSMNNADTGELGQIDPATRATWWYQREPVAQVLEPDLIEGEELDPLLSTKERPLVHLPPAELEQKLPQILEKNTNTLEEDETEA
ncbi:DUF4032 domain-containing protein [Tengunoibacter tsumagoiensis]|uniref:LPS kinase n=1 Tax=Tengunoibacter tsumagoiensis TaxID=2014871 RepID=A0A401ZZ09_9CHLR|nr:DUF4032 domain-containing protein [Tengunoibacter tsumagoiensis]GCE12067.1 LPS kinase [Tengunoibacter tsumagoiensis]